ncbi:MAG TPA: hypothetical protein DCK98_05670 [Chloroflexi bacterium]|jgi:uncharacterized protein (DUF1800 family)|nr:hypothetical protein [Chloroflexota bacterium]HAL27746.1 hypothetical protein [Chloroflexota bacterium]
MDEQAAAPTGTATVKKPAGRVSRRTVVLAAGAAAGGLAVSRVLGLHKLGPDPLAFLDPTSAPVVNTKDWVSPLDKPEAQVAQLLRRATFGMTKAQYDTAVKDGFAKTVDKLIETPPATPKDLAGAEAASQDKPINVTALQSWWLDQMLSTPTPFAERMTYFWHGHFTSDFRKVTTQTPYIYWQNLTWRKIALGTFRDMLYQVTVDPGMLRYLDLGQSTGKAPNENYSRELMELFTMGVGTFTEDDVRAGAKALAGWREPLTQAMIDYQIARAQQQGRTAPRNLVADTVKSGIFEPARAYKGSVTYLGVTKQWDTSAVLDRIMQQASVAPYIADTVIREFVMPDPPDVYVARIAADWKKSGYDVKTLMRDVFMSPEFLQPVAYRSLVKSPTEVMVHLARALEAPQLSRAIAQSGAGMGQALFDPPEVGGWPSNASWVSSNNVLTRVNFVVTTLGGMQKLPAFGNAHQTHIDGIVSEQTAQLLNSATDDQTRWLILLASPEFQLK